VFIPWGNRWHFSPYKTRSKLTVLCVLIFTFSDRRFPDISSWSSTSAV
jgi:hypothetical protein